MLARSYHASEKGSMSPQTCSVRVEAAVGLSSRAGEVATAQRFGVEVDPAWRLRVTAKCWASDRVSLWSVQPCTPSKLYRVVPNVGAFVSAGSVKSSREVPGLAAELALSVNGTPALVAPPREKPNWHGETWPGFRFARVHSGRGTKVTPECDVDALATTGPEGSEPELRSW